LELLISTRDGSFYLFSLNKALYIKLVKTSKNRRNISRYEILRPFIKKLKKSKNNATLFLNKSKNLINHFALLNFCFIKYFALCEINALSEIK